MQQTILRRPQLSAVAFYLLSAGEDELIEML